MDFDKSDVRQIKTQVNLMEDVTWSVIDDERTDKREDEDIGAPSDAMLKRIEIMDDHIVYTMSNSAIVPGLVHGEEDVSIDDIMNEDNDYYNADEFVELGVLELVLGLKVRDGSLRVFHTDEVHFEEDEVKFVLS